MDLIINRGIVKKNAQGEFNPYILKDLKSGHEFPLTDSAMNYHELQEGDLVEFAGRVEGDVTYLAISGVQFGACMN